MKSAYAFALFAVLSLSACQTPMGTPAQKAAATAAMKAEIDCGVAHVKEVDDRISDANTIAFALYTVCSKEYDVATKAWFYAHFEDEDYYNAWYDHRSDPRIQARDFLQIVVTYRSGALKAGRK